MAIPAGPDLAADDGPVNIIQTDTTALSLTNGSWYTAKVVVELQTSWPYANVLTMWVDTDNDADFSDETALLGQFVTGAVGYVGVYRGAEGSTVQQFDDFKLGTDNSSPKDGDFADGGDEIAIDDNFNSAAITLSYDNNGNLTDDGIFAFVYDAWNRLVNAKHRSASNAATIGTYAYDGAMRRTKKVVTNQGPEATANDGGNTMGHFTYDVRWKTVEHRNGSNQCTQQQLGGLQYIDEYIWTEFNGNAALALDTSPDNVQASESAEAPLDHRIFFHHNRNWNVIATSDYGPTANGGLLEHYDYTAYGDTRILNSDYNLEALSAMALTSQVGNEGMYQGLAVDNETGNYRSRHRLYSIRIYEYTTRDPLDQYGVDRTVAVSPSHSITYSFGFSYAQRNANGESAKNRATSQVNTRHTYRAHAELNPISNVDPLGLCCPRSNCTDSGFWSPPGTTCVYIAPTPWPGVMWRMVGPGGTCICPNGITGSCNPCAPGGTWVDSCNTVVSCWCATPYGPCMISAFPVGAGLCAP